MLENYKFKKYSNIPELQFEIIHRRKNITEKIYRDKYKIK